MANKLLDYTLENIPELTDEDRYKAAYRQAHGRPAMEDPVGFQAWRDKFTTVDEAWNASDKITASTEIKTSRGRELWQNVFAGAEHVKEAFAPVAEKVQTAVLIGKNLTEYLLGAPAELAMRGQQGVFRYLMSLNDDDVSGEAAFMRGLVPEYDMENQDYNFEATEVSRFLDSIGDAASGIASAATSEDRAAMLSAIVKENPDIFRMEDKVFAEDVVKDLLGQERYDAYEAWRKEQPSWAAKSLAFIENGGYLVGDIAVDPAWILAPGPALASKVGAISAGRSSAGIATRAERAFRFRRTIGQATDYLDEATNTAQRARATFEGAQTAENAQKLNTALHNKDQAAKLLELQKNQSSGPHTDILLRTSPRPKAKFVASSSNSPEVQAALETVRAAKEAGVPIDKIPTPKAFDEPAQKLQDRILQALSAQERTLQAMPRMGEARELVDQLNISLNRRRGRLEALGHDVLKNRGFQTRQRELQQASTTLAALEKTAPKGKPAKSLVDASMAVRAEDYEIAAEAYKLLGRNADSAKLNDMAKVARKAKPLHFNHGSSPRGKGAARPLEAKLMDAMGNADQDAMRGLREQALGLRAISDKGRLVKDTDSLVATHPVHMRARADQLQVAADKLVATAPEDQARIKAATTMKGWAEELRDSARHLDGLDKFGEVGQQLLTESAALGQIQAAVAQPRLFPVVEEASSLYKMDPLSSMTAAVERSMTGPGATEDLGEALYRMMIGADESDVFVRPVHTMDEVPIFSGHTAVINPVGPQAGDDFLRLINDPFVKNEGWLPARDWDQFNASLPDEARSVLKENMEISDAAAKKAGFTESPHLVEAAKRANLPKEQPGAYANGGIFGTYWRKGSEEIRRFRSGFQGPQYALNRHPAISDRMVAGYRRFDEIMHSDMEFISQQLNKAGALTKRKTYRKENDEVSARMFDLLNDPSPESVAQKLLKESDDFRQSFANIRNWLNDKADQLGISDTAKYLDGYVTYVLPRGKNKGIDDDAFNWVMDGARPNAKVYARMLMDRDGRRTFKGSAYDALSIYARMSNRKLQLEPMLADVEAMGLALKGVDDTAYNLVKNMLPQLKGTPTQLDNYLDSNAVTSGLTKGLGKLVGTQYLSALYGNMKYMMLNTHTALSTTSGNFGPMHTMRGALKMAFSPGTRKTSAQEGLDHLWSRNFASDEAWDAFMAGLADLPGGVSSVEFFLRGLAHTAAQSDEMSKLGVKTIKELEESGLWAKVSSDATNAAHAINGQLGALGRPQFIHNVLGQKGGQSFFFQYRTFHLKQMDQLEDMLRRNPGFVGRYIMMTGVLSRLSATHLGLDMDQAGGFTFAKDFTATTLHGDPTQIGQLLKDMTVMSTAAVHKDEVGAQEAADRVRDFMKMVGTGGLQAQKTRKGVAEITSQDNGVSQVRDRRGNTITDRRMGTFSDLLNDPTEALGLGPKNDKEMLSALTGIDSPIVAQARKDIKDARNTMRKARLYARKYLDDRVSAFMDGDPNWHAEGEEWKSKLENMQLQHLLPDLDLSHIRARQDAIMLRDYWDEAKYNDDIAEGVWRAWVRKVIAREQATQGQGAGN